MQRVLRSWSENPSPGVRYFSGTAVYSTTFDLAPAALARGARLLLDLGDVRELADISVNGKPLGTVWTPPFRVDITAAVHTGRNALAVRIANLWVNRLIGDAQPDAEAKFTFTVIPTYRADAPLRESGLLGPVTLRTITSVH